MFKVNCTKGTAEVNLDKTTAVSFRQYENIEVDFYGEKTYFVCSVGEEEAQKIKEELKRLKFKMFEGKKTDTFFIREENIFAIGTNLIQGDQFYTYFRLQ